MKKHFWTIVAIAFILDSLDLLSTYYASQSTVISYEFNENIPSIEENPRAKQLGIDNIWSLALLSYISLFITCLLYAYHIFIYRDTLINEYQKVCTYVFIGFLKRIKIYLVGSECNKHSFIHLIKSILNFLGFSNIFILIIAKIIVIPTNIIVGYITSNIVSMYQNSFGEWRATLPKDFSTENWFNAFAVAYNNFGLKSTYLWQYRYNIYSAIAIALFIYLFIYKQKRYSWQRED